MKAQFKQDLFNKKFTLQDQGKGIEIDTFDKRIKFWLNIFSNTRGPVPHNFYDYDYDNEGLDETVHGAEIISERREFKNLLDRLRCK